MCVATWALLLSCVSPLGRAHADASYFGTFAVAPSNLRIEQLADSATSLFVSVSERGAAELAHASGISIPWWETRGGVRAGDILRSEMVACSVALHRRGLIGTLKFRF